MVRFKFCFITIMSLLSATLLNAQTQQNKKLLIYLKDKNDNRYSLDKPAEFLSEKSLQRRKKYNIALQTGDLPLSEKYLDQLKAKGIGIWFASRWLNAVCIEASNEQLQEVLQLPFVKPRYELLISRKTNKSNKENQAMMEFQPNQRKPERKPLLISGTSDYGRALNQIQMLKVQEMHRMGFRGERMQIAIFDAGFYNADKISYFKHLVSNNKILGTYNFVDKNTEVFKNSDHGTKVLSALASYQPGEIIGTAPEASFYLFRTEDSGSEYRIEEFNWLIAAEKADSLGVDIITSSLGYNTFDDASMNYKYEMMDGDTPLSTKAADLAAARGILVVTSAGNEGDNAWQFIGAPADADSVLTVGAVDQKSAYAYFSSKGPTSDKRIKPDVSAMGVNTSVVSGYGEVVNSNGTSFSTPLVCGLAAGLWEAHPELTNMEIIEALQKSSDLAKDPNPLTGYGIPDFLKAIENAKRIVEQKKVKITQVILQPRQKLEIQLGNKHMNQLVRCRIFNLKNKCLLKKELLNDKGWITIEDSEQLTSGEYKLILEVGSHSQELEFRVL